MLTKLNEYGYVFIDRDAVKKYARRIFKNNTANWSWIRCAREALYRAEEQLEIRTLRQWASRQTFPQVPLRAAAVIQAEETKRGDMEKVATTPIKYMVYKGVKIQSRYDKADEYLSMMHLIAAIEMYNSSGVSHIESIWCNSNTDGNYTIYLRKFPHDEPYNMAADGFYYDLDDSDEYPITERGDEHGWHGSMLTELHVATAYAVNVNYGHNEIYFDFGDLSMTEELSNKMYVYAELDVDD